MIGLSRLGQADNCLRGSGGLQVALAGAVGSDTLGSFFAAQAAKAGVAILADTLPESCTGTYVLPASCTIFQHVKLVQPSTPALLLPIVLTSA